MKNLWLLAALVAVLALAGCSKVSQTEETILAWGMALNTHLTTGGTDFNYSFPARLEDIDAELTVGLKDVDAWGNKLFYRVLPGDIYNLISPGPDGQLGNDDDVVMQNGLLYDAAQIYGAAPLNR
jgi:hypothetical protein